MYSKVFVVVAKNIRQDEPSKIVYCGPGNEELSKACCTAYLQQCRIEAYHKYGYALLLLSMPDALIITSGPRPWEHSLDFDGIHHE